MAEDPLTVHARARVGRVLRGKWKLDRLIGVGGMAAVYEATHRNGSKVAIKMLHPTLMFDTNFAQRLIQEGYVANKINHPAAVRVYDDDSDEVDGAVFLVMELLDGKTLSAVRRERKRIPPVEVFQMMTPVLEALASAHSKGIIHRDIKPENLFRTTDGVIHVLDFGIARVSDGSNVSATRTGMVVGSPAYMSPEQALGKMNCVDARTDVYSLGATMFALIAGATPHAGETTQEMIVMVATQAARPLRSVMKDVNPRIAAIIDKALAYEREKRFADAAVMLTEMQRVVAEMELVGGDESSTGTFGDEGETHVQANPFTAEDEHPTRTPAPLPAAGNRIATGPAPLPAVPLPASTTASKVRAPTLAPNGAPLPMGAPTGFGPAPAGPPALGPKPAGPPPFGPPPAGPPAFAPPPAPPPGMSPALAARLQSMDMPLDDGVPATLAFDGPLPDGNPFAPPTQPYLDGPPGSSSRAEPATMAFPAPSAMVNVGTASGPRPGVTTGMAWTGAPMPPVAPPPPKRSNKGLVAAVVAVFVLSGIGITVRLVFLKGHSARPAVQLPQVTVPTPPVVPPLVNPPGSDLHPVVQHHPVLPVPPTTPTTPTTPTPTTPVANLGAHVPPTTPGTLNNAAGSTPTTPPTTPTTTTRPTTPAAANTPTTTPPTTTTRPTTPAAANTPTTTPTTATRPTATTTPTTATRPTTATTPATTPTTATRPTATTTPATTTRPTTPATTPATTTPIRHPHGTTGTPGHRPPNTSTNPLGY